MPVIWDGSIFVLMIAYRPSKLVEMGQKSQRLLGNIRMSVLSPVQSPKKSETPQKGLALFVAVDLVIIVLLIFHSSYE